MSQDHVIKLRYSNDIQKYFKNRATESVHAQFILLVLRYVFYRVGLQIRRGWDILRPQKETYDKKAIIYEDGTTSDILD